MRPAVDWSWLVTNADSHPIGQSDANVHAAAEPHPIGIPQRHPGADFGMAAGRVHDRRGLGGIPDWDRPCHRGSRWSASRI